MISVVNLVKLMKVTTTVPPAVAGQPRLPARYPFLTNRRQARRHHERAAPPPGVRRATWGRQPARVERVPARRSSCLRSRFFRRPGRCLSAAPSGCAAAAPWPRSPARRRRDTGRRYRTRSMPAKNGRRWRFSGLARIRIAPTCATTSVRIVGGSTGDPVGRMRQVALVERHILDADDALVDFEFGDAVDEQERVAVLQNAFDRGVVERKRQVHRNLRLYCHPQALAHLVIRMTGRLIGTSSRALRGHRLNRSPDRDDDR